MEYPFETSRERPQLDGLPAIEGLPGHLKEKKIGGATVTVRLADGDLHIEKRPYWQATQPGIAEKAETDTVGSPAMDPRRSAFFHDEAQDNMAFEEEPGLQSATSSEPGETSAEEPVFLMPGLSKLNEPASGPSAAEAEESLADPQREPDPVNDIGHEVAAAQGSVPVSAEEEPIAIEPPSSEVVLVPPVAQTTPPRSSARLSGFHAFKRANQTIEQQLGDLTTALASSKHSWSLLQPQLRQVEADIVRSDEVESERDTLSLRVPFLERELERRNKEVEDAAEQLGLAQQRIEEMRDDLGAARKVLSDNGVMLERSRLVIDKASGDIAALRQDYANLKALHEQQSLTKETLDQTRLDLENKVARLTQAEALLRGRSTELELQNDKFRNQVPLLLADQESMQNQLRAANRERVDLQGRLQSSQDRIAQLEGQVESLEGQLVSATYSARSELETSQSATRATARMQSDYEARLEEVRTRLREVESWNNAAEKQLAASESELELVRQESVSAAARLSEINLKYMTDLLALDQYRLQNAELQESLDTLLTENRRLAKYETLHRTAGSQIASLRGRIDALVQSTNKASSVADHLDLELIEAMRADNQSPNG